MTQESWSDNKDRLNTAANLACSSSLRVAVLAETPLPENPRSDIDLLLRPDDEGLDSDPVVSGAVPAKDRPGFSELLKYVREGDVVHVYAVDRLGRDALDVQATVRGLIKRGVTVEVRGLGTIAQGAGELILAVLA